MSDWDNQSQPPAYSVVTAQHAASYEPPTSHIIGAKTLKQPLVRVGELKAHLSLLHAFKGLRTSVENGQIAEWPELVRILDPLQRWTWFVGLAVDRFQRWIDVQQGLSLGATLELELPPLDVIMVWHAYLLNPSWYAEDCMRLAPLNPLRGVRDHLLSALGRIEDMSCYDATPERKQLWLWHTGTPFDPIEAATLATDHVISCPKCFLKLFVPYVLLNGTGYMQSKFRVTCHQCGFNLNRDSLATLKFVRDLVLDPRNDQDKRQYGQGVYLAGSLRTLIHPCDEQVATNLKVKFSVVFPRPSEEPETTDKNECIKMVMEQVDYRIANVRRIGAPAANDNARRFTRILSAYFDDRPFSVELVGAVIRQCSFIDKMHQCGWTAPDAFDRQEDKVVLQHAIARYHAFLDLKASSPLSFYAPTLDIDLAWHTHQMKGEMYQSDCKQYLGQFLDHEDKVDENILATAFDDTCKAWEARYHLPYTYCGCPLPRARAPLTQRLSRLGRRLTPPASLIPPQRADALAATHASEHNAVYIAAQDGAVRRAREAEMLARRMRDAELARKGKMDREAVARAAEHQVAFLGPVDDVAPPAFGLVVVGNGDAEASGV